MASVNNYMNTGLISQNYDVINNVTKKYGGVCKQSYSGRKRAS